jgi:hypothetical protein
MPQGILEAGNDAGIREAPLDKIGEESPWQGYRHQVQAPNHDIKCCKNHLQITQYSDMVNRDTNKMFTWDEWEDFVEIAETQRLDGPPGPMGSNAQDQHGLRDPEQDTQGRKASIGSTKRHARCETRGSYIRHMGPNIRKHQP